MFIRNGNAKDAASDLITHLNNIRRSLPDDGENYLVSVILDGENAWEYYKNNGWDFLSELYEKLSNEPGHQDREGMRFS